jgi:hypothetical protein
MPARLRSGQEKLNWYKMTGGKNSEVRIQNRELDVWPFRHSEFSSPATLLEFGTAGVGGFGGPILVNDHVLVAVEGAPAGRVVYLGIRVESVA